jgi:hypothetical protein
VCRRGGRRGGSAALDLVRCKLPGVWANSLDVGASLSFEDSRLSGPVHLVGSRIGADVICLGATFEPGPSDGPALQMTAADVGGSVRLTTSEDGARQFTAEGRIQLQNVKIGADLICSDARIRGSSGMALVATAAEIGVDVWMVGACVEGETQFLGATIGAGLDCSGARLSNAPGDVLTLDGATIGGNVTLGPSDDDPPEPMTAEGVIRMVGTTIAGSLDCRDAVLRNPAHHALTMDGASLAISLDLHACEIDGGVRLFRTSVPSLVDDVPDDGGLGSWTNADPLLLDGFAFERFGGDATWKRSARSRWLKSTDGYQPAAWKHLSGVYEATGRDGDARQLRIDAENDRLDRGGLNPLRVVGRWLLRVLIGHGYRPWLAGVWGLGIIVAFAIAVARSSKFIDPSDDAPNRDPQAFVYAADTFLPIINFGEAELWATRPDLLYGSGL